MAEKEKDKFFVRLGDSDDGPFAICEQIGTLDPRMVLPGTGKTVAELIADQPLSAAAAPPDPDGEITRFAALHQVGENRGRNG